jgi:hypothetical protein
MKKKAMTLLVVLCMAMSISALSAAEKPVSRQLPATVETRIEGAGCQERAAGVMVGLAVGALSPCSVFCAIGALYTAVAGSLLCAD